MHSFRWKAFVSICKVRPYILVAASLLCFFWPYKSVAEVFLWPAVFGITCGLGWISDGKGTWLTESMFRPGGVQVHLFKRITGGNEYRQSMRSIISWAQKAEATGLRSMSLVSPNAAFDASDRIEHLVVKIQAGLKRPARIEQVDASAALVSPLYFIFHRSTDAQWQSAKGIKEKFSVMCSLRNRGFVVYFDRSPV